VLGPSSTWLVSLATAVPLLLIISHDFHFTNDDVIILVHYSKPLGEALVNVEFHFHKKSLQGSL